MRDKAEETRACADCGDTEELYFHEGNEAWVCEDPGLCIERQRDQARAERDRYRQALVTIVTLAGLYDGPKTTATVKRTARKALGWARDEKPQPDGGRTYG